MYSMLFDAIVEGEGCILLLSFYKTLLSCEWKLSRGQFKTSTVDNFWILLATIGVLPGAYRTSLKISSNGLAFQQKALPSLLSPMVGLRIAWVNRWDPPQSMLTWWQLAPGELKKKDLRESADWQRLTVLCCTHIFNTTWYFVDCIAKKIHSDLLNERRWVSQTSKEPECKNQYVRWFTNVTSRIWMTTMPLAQDQKRRVAAVHVPIGSWPLDWG